MIEKISKDENARKRIKAGQYHNVPPLLLSSIQEIVLGQNEPLLLSFPNLFA